MQMMIIMGINKITIFMMMAMMVLMMTMKMTIKKTMMILVLIDL